MHENQDIVSKLMFFHTICISAFGFRGRATKLRLHFPGFFIGEGRLILKFPTDFRGVLFASIASLLPLLLFKKITPIASQCLL